MRVNIATIISTIFQHGLRDYLLDDLWVVLHVEPAPDVVVLNTKPPSNINGAKLDENVYILDRVTLFSGIRIVQVYKSSWTQKSVSRDSIPKFCPIDAKCITYTLEGYRKLVRLK